MVCSSGKVASKAATLAPRSLDCRGRLWLYPKQVQCGLPSRCITGCCPLLLAPSRHTLAHPGCHGAGGDSEELTVQGRLGCVASQAGWVALLQQGCFLPVPWTRLSPVPFPNPDILHL